MRFSIQAGIFLLSAIVVIETQAQATSYSPVNEKQSYSLNSCNASTFDDNWAKMAQLRSEIATMLIHELRVNKEEAEQIISVAKYLTPSGRDINKVGIVNAKLRELQQLERTYASK